jgi:peptidoglycan/xylan/chitin deacetylase (PgdA/CDA1 family)
VFAVAGLVGGTNRWDRHLGARALPLLDTDGLHALVGAGLEIGSHGLAHRPLVKCSPEELRDELGGSAERLVDLGLPRPRALSYPHGAWDGRVAEAARRAGYAIAFTVDPGVAARASDPLAIPRVEVLRSDSPLTLRLKVAACGWPAPWAGRLRRALAAWASRPRRGSGPS